MDWSRRPASKAAFSASAWASLNSSSSRSKRGSSTKRAMSFQLLMPSFLYRPSCLAQGDTMPISSTVLSTFRKPFTLLKLVIQMSLSFLYVHCFECVLAEVAWRRESAACWDWLLDSPEPKRTTRLCASGAKAGMTASVGSLSEVTIAQRPFRSKDPTPDTQTGLSPVEVEDTLSPHQWLLQLSWTQLHRPRQRSSHANGVVRRHFDDALTVRKPVLQHNSHSRLNGISGLTLYEISVL
eukprot:6172347-Pleurochrysis_carterae.AAC.1